MRRLALIALAAALLAPPAFAKSVLRKRSVGEGLPGLTLGCPRGYAALNGASLTLPFDVILARSTPARGRRGWSFAFSTGGPSRVGAVLRCQRARRVATIRRSGVTIDSGATRALTLRCPRGLSPTGYGEDETSGDPGAIYIYEVWPLRRGLRFRLYNDTSDSSEIDLAARCAPVRMRRRVFRNRLRRNGTLRVKHSCRRGETSLATGWSLRRRQSAFLRSSYPERRRRGRWIFENAVGTTRARVALVCLAR